MITLLLGSLLIASTLGSVPSCAVLFSFGNESVCQQRFASIWLGAAQAEAARFYHTANGGFLEPDCVQNEFGRAPRLVRGVNIPWSRTVCVFRDHLPVEKCATARCNFTSHAELFTNEDASMRSERGAAVRSIRSWIDIANGKLVRAIRAYESCNFNASVSLSCVADFIFQQIARSLVDIDAPTSAHPRLYYFLDAAARHTQRYHHINGPVQTLVYIDDLNANATFEFVTVQSQRLCGAHFNVTTARTTSLLLYTNFTAASGDLSSDTDLDLVYAGTGVVPSFSQVFEGDVNDCASRNTPPTFSPAFDESLRLEALTRNDFAVVEYSDGTQSACYDLGTGGVCTVVLLKHANITRAVRRSSVTQINFFQPPTTRNATAFQGNVTAAVLLVDGSIDVCKEFRASVISNTTSCTNGSEPSTVVVSASRTAAARLLSAQERGVPLTLAPDESQCVGGERHGARCTMPSECAPHEACRRKPFTAHNVAYCYDGESWDEERTCAFADADDECPFGECFGAVNDNSGGAYPFFYFFAQNNCSSALDDPVCRDEHVANWFKYPNPLYANENYFAQDAADEDEVLVKK